MPNFLPTVFIVLGASALVLTLFWLWLSLRHVLTAVPVVAPGETSGGVRARTDLLSEKKALLVALKDLEAERETGKLSETDFVELNARYRARAREVLKALDKQLAPHRGAARALLSGEASAGGSAAPAVAAAAPAPAVTAAAAPPVVASAAPAVAAAATAAPVASSAAPAVAAAAATPVAGSASAAPVAGSGAAPAAGSPARSCVSCSADNDMDAVFCKKCGTRLAAESQR